MSSAPLRYEPMAAENWDDPYPTYRALRERAPLHRAPDSGIYVLSRYEDVEFALRNPNVFSSSGMEKMLFGDRGRGGLRWRDYLSMLRFFLRARTVPFLGERPRTLVMLDPPRHDEMRKVVNRGFSPRRISALEPRMREIVAGCMERISQGETFDVVRDLSIPLPVTVIAEMLGVAADDMSAFKRWSDAVISASSGAAREGGLAAVLDPMGEMRGYMRGIVRDRRREPRDDLISVLVDSKHSHTLSEDEVFGFISLLLVAGNETTTNLISNATLSLLANPEELAKVKQDPSLIPSMLEETLRYESPVQMLFRSLTEDIELPSGKLPAGADVTLLLGSANRDPSVFDEPDRFDVARNPRGHLAFGFGVHFCLGASLARLEAKVAMEALIPQLPEAEAPASPEFIDSYMLRGLERLELRA